jgi:hypothetical protein
MERRGRVAHAASPVQQTGFIARLLARCVYSWPMAGVGSTLSALFYPFRDSYDYD